MSRRSGRRSTTDRIGPASGSRGETSGSIRRRVFDQVPGQEDGLQGHDQRERGPRTPLEHQHPQREQEHVQVDGVMQHIGIEPGHSPAS